MVQPEETLMANQIVVRKIGEAGYGKNIKPPPYIPRNEQGVPLSEIRKADDKTKGDPIFDSNNEVRG